MLRILVTGASGQLGMEFRDLAGRYDKLDFIFADRKQLDITDNDALNAFFKEYKVDYVINGAAYTNVEQAEREREVAEAINVLGPMYLSRLSKCHNFRLIHVSTDYVFDGRSHFPYKESYPAYPTCVYGITKFRGENVVSRMNPEAYVIRTSWLYSSHRKNFVKTIMSISEKQDTLNVVADQVGTPTYARDLAKAILTIINRLEDDPDSHEPGIYHYANEGITSWYDFAHEILTLSSSEATVTPIDSKSFLTNVSRPYYSVLDKQKIKNQFDISIPHWKESLKSCITLIKKQQCQEVY
ncbi:MAG: dTDP-4-dehydrorhamnose reductase [Bacteroidota bacterium]